MGVCLAFIYTLVASTCVVTFGMQIQHFELSLWPFIYIFVCFLILARPYFSNSPQLDNFTKVNTRNCNIFLFIFVIAALVNICYSLNSTVSMIANDNVLDVYNDKDTLSMSTNRLDWLCKNILGYFTIVFSLVLFYMLSIAESRKKTLMLVAIYMIVFISVILTSAMRALRWNMLHDIVCLTSGYILLYNTIPRSNRRIINLLILIGGLLLISFFLFISYSRHSFAGSAYGGDSNAAFIFYLGHSMMVFNYGVVDTINQYANGCYLWGIPYPANGVHTDGDFPTLIGNMYIDFGPILTIGLSVLLSVIFNFKKRITGIADAYIVTFYYQFLFMGVFTQAFGYGRGFMYCLIIYVLLKKLL